MKNVEVLGINLALSELKSDGLYGVKFSHALIKNIETFQKEAKNIAESLVYPEGFLKYTEEMEKVFKEHALKDEKGELVIKENKYQVDPSKREAFKKIQEEKSKAYSKVIEEAKKAEEAYNNALDDEKNINIRSVKLEELPETITPEQMNVLSFMIEDI